jgi:uncharacterized BrkB/YihY/UPF0761 family membrane protein
MDAPSQLDSPQMQVPQKNSPWKTSLMIAAVFALVSLPFTKSVFEKTIPALQNNSYIYLLFASIVMYVGTLIILQSNQ